MYAPFEKTLSKKELESRGIEILSSGLKEFLTNNKLTPGQVADVENY